MLRGLFDMNNPVMRFLNRVADLLALNIMFIICSIPIITVGASTTALYYTLLKMKDEEEGYLYKRFFKSFRENLKQSTILWLIFLVIALLLLTEFLMYRDVPSQTGYVMRVMVLVGMALWYMISIYVFALQARFYNTVGGTIKNGMLLMIANAPRSAAMLAIIVVLLYATFNANNFYVYWNMILLWILFGFSATAWANTQLLYPVIQKLMPPEEKEDEITPDSAFTVDEETELTAIGFNRTREDPSNGQTAPDQEPLPGPRAEDQAP